MVLVVLVQGCSNDNGLTMLWSSNGRLAVSCWEKAMTKNDEYSIDHCFGGGWYICNNTAHNKVRHGHYGRSTITLVLLLAHTCRIVSG